MSTEQHAYAQRRANEIGVGDRVRFLLKDYRQEDGRYDRIVSVGMFEHVGVGHYREYFEKVRDLLDDDGVALIHTIGRADGPGAANAWINKYIFPGGYVPALSEILPAIERAGLYVTDIEVLRLHYAETLKAWRQRFNANRRARRRNLRRAVLPHVGILPGGLRGSIPPRRPGEFPDPVEQARRCRAFDPRLHPRNGSARTSTMWRLPALAIPPPRLGEQRRPCKVTLVRSFLFDLTFYLWTILLSVVALPALLVSQRATIWISELWAIVSLLLLRLIVGLSYEVRGRHNLPKGAVIVALKHQSAWETIALWVLLKNPAIVLKQSLTRIPVFGWYMRRGQAIVIDRDAGPRALKPMVAAARSAVAEGRPIAIFPEGTRTPAGVRRAYQPGVAALYMQLGLPIVPVALNSGLFWGRRSFLKRSGTDPRGVSAANRASARSAARHGRTRAPHRGRNGYAHRRKQASGEHLTRHTCHFWRALIERQ